MVSGDVTYRGSRSGFEVFSSLIAELSDCAPVEKERIIVVPGNHDVHWGTKPSTQERYAGFIDVIRGAGYATPVLEGIDPLDHIGRTSAGPIVHIGDDVILAAINSSNYSGVLEEAPG